MDDQPVNPNPPATWPQDSAQPASDLSGGSEKSQPAFHKIFLGPNGLRAGWRLLIYLAMVYLFGLVLNKSLHAAGYKAPPLDKQFSPNFVALSRLGNFLVLLIPAFIMARIERTRVGVYGLPARGAFGKKFWEGIVWGFVSLSI